MQKNLTAAAALVLTLFVAPCSASSPDQAAPSGGLSAPVGAAAPSSTTGTTPDHADQDNMGTVVRFTVRSESVDVTIGEDSPHPDRSGCYARLRRGP